MKKSIFMGISILEPGDSILDDNAAFIQADRAEFDRVAKIAVKTHRHDGSEGLTDPVAAPSGQIIASGGQIAGDVGISLGYTLEDADGGETLISPATTLTTPGPLDVPLVAPEGVFSSAAGALLADTYTYALTHTDGAGGETPVGPAVTVTRPPGFANGQIVLTGLNTGLEEAGAAGWRLYRARGGGQYVLLATGGGEDSEFTDDGGTEPDCDTHPPTDNVNTTEQVNQLEVTLPSGGGIEAATFINLYASLTGDFGEASLLAQYPVASAGASDLFTSLDVVDQRPPDVNRSYGGAPQIDPDTELLDWHWKRPVESIEKLPSEGNEEGDVRAILGAATPTLYMYLEGEWQEIETGGGSSGPGTIKVLLPGADEPGFYDGFSGETLDPAWQWIIGEETAEVTFLELTEGVVKPTETIGGIGRRVVSPPEWSNGVVTFKTHTGAAAFGSNGLFAGILARWQNENDYIRITLSESASLINVEGAGEESVAEEAAFGAEANTDYWIRVTVAGNTVTAQVYTSDPDGGAAPVFEMSGTITGEEAKASVGDGVAGKMLWWIPPVETDWNWDDFRVETGETFYDPGRLELHGASGVSIDDQGDSDWPQLTLSTPLPEEGMGVLVLTEEEKGIERPNQFKQYTWFCKVEPENLGTFDIWIEEGP